MLFPEPVTKGEWGDQDGVYQSGVVSGLGRPGLLLSTPSRAWERAEGRRWGTTLGGLQRGSPGAGYFLVLSVTKASPPFLELEFQRVEQ